MCVGEGDKGPYIQEAGTDIIRLIPISRQSDPQVVGCTKKARSHDIITLGPRLTREMSIEAVFFLVVRNLSYGAVKVLISEGGYVKSLGRR